MCSGVACDSGISQPRRRITCIVSSKLLQLAPEKRELSPRIGTGQVNCLCAALGRLFARTRAVVTVRSRMRFDQGPAYADEAAGGSARPDTLGGDAGTFEDQEQLVGDQLRLAQAGAAAERGQAGALLLLE